LHVVGFVIRVVSYLLLFFGLYLPFFYLLYGLIIHLLLEVKLFDFSANSQLFLLGLLLTIVSAVIISVRNLVMIPLRNVIAYCDRKNLPEQPEIYQSQLQPDLTIYEYKNRFDVYRRSNGRLLFLRTEYKRR
ncbi:MAG: hypothetical protein RSB20_05920, partial [Clostridia bacterium]